MSCVIPFRDKTATVPIQWELGELQEDCIASGVHHAVRRGATGFRFDYALVPRCNGGGSSWRRALANLQPFYPRLGELTF